MLDSRSLAKHLPTAGCHKFSSAMSIEILFMHYNYTSLMRQYRHIYKMLDARSILVIYILSIHLLTYMNSTYCSSSSSSSNTAPHHIMQGDARTEQCMQIQCFFGGWKGGGEGATLSLSHRSRRICAACPHVLTES